MITVAMSKREAHGSNPAASRLTDWSESPIYLALGSNLGDREANLREAIRRITALGLTVTRRSSIYETEPVGFADQDWFLNQVIEAWCGLHRLGPGFSQREAAVINHMTSLDGWDMAQMFACGLLLGESLRIESEMGRRRDVPNGPRTIDIDLLLCGRLEGVFDSTSDGVAGHLWREHQLPELILPHPRLHLRRFVLAPLAEIAPAVIHPTLQKNVQELLAAVEDLSIVRFYQATD
jgi:2-amino-4-hydroxy-6-hydroxymethyldihydropteridine diphosphokinase